MAQFRYAFTALRVITDRDTNTNSYIDVVDGFTLPALPAVLPQFAIASVWEQGPSPGQLQMRIRFFGPDNSELLPPFEVPVQEIAAGATHRINLNLGGVPVQQVGRHYIAVEEQSHGKWNEVGRVQLDVKYVPPKPVFVVKHENGTQTPLKR